MADSGAKDIPAVPQGIDSAVRTPMMRAREEIQRLLGFLGDPLDKAITRRDAISIGLMDEAGNPLGGGTPGPVGPIGPTGPAGGTYTPDLTPPPTVTGLALTAGFGYVFIEWDAAVYTQGHGHLQTNLYGVKKLSSDATLPTFADAVLVYSATGALTIAALPSDLGIRWHVWAKYETNDLVESTSPAGGANGVSGTVGKIGSTDLTPLIITARELAASNPGVFPDQDFQGGALTWVGFVQRLPAGDPSVPASCPRTYAAQFSGRDSVSWGVKTTVFPGEKYRLSLYVNRTGLSSGVDAGVVVYYIDGTGTVFSTGVVMAPSNTSTAWQRAEGILQIPATTVAMVVGPWINQAHGGPAMAWFAGLLVEKAIDASLVTANMIAVGSAAIENGAIRNALIENAAIDNAKIANVSADKLTVGTGIIGGPLKSSNYVGGVSGWIVLPNGAAEFSFAHIRGVLTALQIAANTITTDKLVGGAVMGGNFTGFAWPAPGGTGFYLGPSGLLLGNYNDGKYFQVGANGDIYAPGFSIVGGNATFSGTLAAGIVNTAALQIGSINVNTTSLTADGNFTQGNFTAPAVLSAANMGGASYANPSGTDTYRATFHFDVDAKGSGGGGIAGAYPALHYRLVLNGSVVAGSDKYRFLYATESSFSGTVSGDVGPGQTLALQVFGIYDWITSGSAIGGTIAWRNSAVTTQVNKR